MSPLLIQSDRKQRQDAKTNTRVSVTEIQFKGLNEEHVWVSLVPWRRTLARREKGTRPGVVGVQPRRYIARRLDRRGFCCAWGQRRRETWRVLRGKEVTDELLEVGVKAGSSYTASSST